MKKNRKGFTLIELLATVVILGIILAVTGYVVVNVIAKARERSYKVTLNEISSNASNYMTERKGELFFITSSDGSKEYQCLTVNNLIDKGYLKDTIVKSEIDKNVSVKKDGFIYIERDPKTKNVTKSYYVTDTAMESECRNAASAVADIVYMVSPSGWSQKKDIIITYRLKNTSTSVGVDSYKYDYVYSQDNISGNGNYIDLNNGMTNLITVTKNGNMNAHITLDGKSLVNKDPLIINNIDTVRPTIDSTYNGSNTVNNTITIPIVVSDNASGIKKSITVDDIEVTIGGEKLTKTGVDNYSLTQTSKTDKEIKYNLVIKNGTHNGKLNIKIAANKVSDKADNYNLLYEFGNKHNVTMHAVYTVTFNGNGGTANPTSKTVTYGSTYGTLATATKTGYTLEGWYTAASGGTKVDAGTKVTITANQTLYAHYKANTYTVTFNGNGGTASQASKNVTYDSTYGTLPTASRTGYTFSGWYTSTSNGTKIDTGTKVTITGNQTLYARWTANTYTVTFNGNGGTVSSSSKKVSYDGTYGTLPTASLTGYTFQGWYTAKSGGTQVVAGTKVTITGNQTLYARWKANTYTVVFNGNGGTISGNSSKTVTYNATYGTLPTASRTGYTFTGWYTATSGGTQVAAGTTVKITGNQTLYAQWRANTYTVTFNANGGSVSTGSKSVTYGGTYGTLPTPTKSGNRFDGWFTAATGGTQVATGTKVSITSNQTLYAHWTVIEYTVTLERGNFSAYGSRVYSRTSSAYNKWQSGGGTLTKKSSGSYYLDGSPKFKIKPGQTYGDIILCDDKVGSSSVYSCFDVTSGVFEGWYTAASGGTRIRPTTVFNGSSNITLYGHWRRYVSSSYSGGGGYSGGSSGGGGGGGCSGCCAGHCACCLCCNDSAYWSNQYDQWRS